MYNLKKIIIRKNSKIYGVHSLLFDYTQKDYSIEISDFFGNIIFTGEIIENTTININIELLKTQKLNIRYYSKTSGDCFHIDTLNIEDYLHSEKIDKKYDEIMQQIYRKLDNPTGSESEIEEHTLMIKKSAFDKKAREYVETKIREALLSEYQKFDLDIDINHFIKETYAKFYGMSILQELDDDKDIAEIMVNAVIYPRFKCDIYYNKTNMPKMKYEKTFENFEDMINVFSRSIAFSRKELNAVENAIIEATRANGDRLNIIVPQASENYILNIRKFDNFIPNYENMLKSGTVNEDIDRLLKSFVKGKANIGIGGEMGTGKTSFINYLLGYTNPIERKVIISSVKEIGANSFLDGHDIVFLKVDEEQGFTFSKLIRTSLRTTANRIIIPESRGGEFKQVYEANLKTKGNMFTAHALDDSSFLDVCADMYMEDTPSDPRFIKNKIAKSIDIIVIMKKIDDQIRIKSISEVVLNSESQLQNLNVLYYWDYGINSGVEGYVRTKNKISNALRLRLLEEKVPADIVNKL